MFAAAAWAHLHFFCVPRPTHPAAISVSIFCLWRFVCCLWSISTAIIVFVLASVLHMSSLPSSLPQPLIFRLTTSPCKFVHCMDGGALYHRSLPTTFSWPSASAIGLLPFHKLILSLQCSSPLSVELRFFFPRRVLRASLFTFGYSCSSNTGGSVFVATCGSADVPSLSSTIAGVSFLCFFFVCVSCVSCFCFLLAFLSCVGSVVCFMFGCIVTAVVCV